MRRDKKAPALYELMRGKQPAAVQPKPPSRPPAAVLTPASGEGERTSWPRPGSVLRLPVGYLYFAIGAVLVLVLIAYLIGYKKREAEERTLREQEAARQFDGTTDPLLNLATNPRLLEPGQPQPNPQSEIGQSRPAGDRESTQPARALPVQGAAGRVVRVSGPSDDPREAGLNYMIAATLIADEAEKAAGFLASRGLEVALVPVDNQPSQRWVVVLQGMGPKDWYGPEGKHLEDQVKQLGREYKRAGGPETFKDPYWKKYTR